MKPDWEAVEVEAVERVDIDEIDDSDEDDVTVSSTGEDTVSACM